MLVTERDREAANRATYLCAQGDFDDLCSFLSEWRDEAVRDLQVKYEALDRVEKIERERRVLAEQERDEAVKMHDVVRAICAEANVHHPAVLLRNLRAAEARLRAVIEAANGLLTMTRDLLRRLDSHEPHEIDVNGVRRAIARYQGVLDAQPPASAEPEASPRADHAFAFGLTPRGYGRVPGLQRMTCVHCGLPWSQHGGHDDGK